MKVTLTLGPGRKFLCLGPNCWGKGATADEAIKNAKSNFPRIYHSKWCYVLFDVVEDAEIDDMGSICYTPREGEVPYREVARHNM